MFIYKIKYSQIGTGAFTCPKLWKTNVDGVLVHASTETNLHDWAMNQEQCSSMASTHSVNNECLNAIIACMNSISNDGYPMALVNTACLATFTDQNLWKTTPEQVCKMNPKLAYKMLTNLGFKGKLNKGVIKVERVKDWFKRITDNDLYDNIGTNVDVTTIPVGSTVGENDAQTLIIGSRTILEPFLELVVDFVDSNSAILNKNPQIKSISGEQGVSVLIGGYNPDICLN